MRERLWRTSNPNLDEEDRQRLVGDLMAARRAVRAAKANPAAMAQARAAVDVAKVALGERGSVWWNDGSPDYNRKLVVTTPYADWYAALSLQS